MDSKEAIMAAAIGLIEENGENLEEITVREICKRAGVGLGLVNYHFGNKDKLIEQCVERIINGIIEQFRDMREQTAGLAPFEKLEHLGNITLDFLFRHYAISKISILTDMKSPKIGDNTFRTYEAYLPLVADCRPDWDEQTVKRKTLCLIADMQQLLLRYGVMSQALGCDLSEKEVRRELHARILKDILEVQ